MKSWYKGTSLTRCSRKCPTWIYGSNLTKNVSIRNVSLMTTTETPGLAIKTFNLTSKNHENPILLTSANLSSSSPTKSATPYRLITVKLGRAPLLRNIKAYHALADKPGRVWYILLWKGVSDNLWFSDNLEEVRFGQSNRLSQIWMMLMRMCRQSRLIQLHHRRYKDSRKNGKALSRVLYMISSTENLSLKRFKKSH